MGGEQAASVLAQVKQDQLAREGKPQMTRGRGQPPSSSRRWTSTSARAAPTTRPRACGTTASSRLEDTRPALGARAGSSLQRADPGDEDGRRADVMKVVSAGVLLLIALLCCTVSCDRRTPIVRAAINNDTAKVQQLLASGVPASKLDVTGTTALHYAAYNNNTDMAKALIAGGADKDHADPSKATPSLHRCP